MGKKKKATKPVEKTQAKSPESTNVIALDNEQVEGAEPLVAADAAEVAVLADAAEIAEVSSVVDSASVAPAPVPAMTPDELTAHILEAGAAIEDTVIATRRYFHAHPELSTKELSTSNSICARLTRMGIPYERVAKTGIIATIKGEAPDAYDEQDNPRRRIALRADIDALPVRVFRTSLRTPASCTRAATTATSPCCWVLRAY